MAVDLDEIEVRQAIDHPGRGNLADAAKVIGVDFVDRPAVELFGAGGNAIEHLIWPLEIVDGAENEIEAIPVLLDPGTARPGSFRIVVELETRPDFHVGVGVAQFVDLVEIDARVIAIVIGKRDVAQTPAAGAVDPGLEQSLRERLNTMALRVG